MANILYPSSKKGLDRDSKVECCQPSSERSHASCRCSCCRIVLAFLWLVFVWLIFGWLETFSLLI